MNSQTRAIYATLEMAEVDYKFKSIKNESKLTSARP